MLDVEVHVARRGHPSRYVYDWYAIYKALRKQSVIGDFKRLTFDWN